MPASRLRDIPTRWSVLKGAPRDALDYLYRTYGTAILAYIRARLARGDFAPLTADDAEDVMQDFFLRLGSTEWLSKPDPTRGRFRPYLVQRLVFFLRERRASMASRPAIHNDQDGAIELLAEADPLDAAFEREWKAATVRTSLDRIGRKNAAWRTALDADLRRSSETDVDVALQLGWTIDSLRSTLKRARAAFRDVYGDEVRRLDGFGGGSFDALS